MNKTKRWQSVRRQREASLSRSKQLSSATTISWKLYTDCGRLPLDRFIACLLDQEYENLIISGEPPKEEIDNAWNKIFTEYSTFSGGEQYNTVFIKTKHVNLLITKIFIIENLCENLKWMYDETACKILNGYALMCDINENDTPKERYAKVDMILSRSKRFVTKLEVLQKELKDAQTETATGLGGRDYFDDMLNIMSQHSGFMIRATDITVSRFIKMINNLNDLQHKQKLQSLKNGA